VPGHRKIATRAAGRTPRRRRSRCSAVIPEGAGRISLPRVRPPRRRGS